MKIKTSLTIYVLCIGYHALAMQTPQYPANQLGALKLLTKQAKVCAAINATMEPQAYGILVAGSGSFVTFNNNQYAVKTTKDVHSACDQVLELFAASIRATTLQATDHSTKNSSNFSSEYLLF